MLPNKAGAIFFFIRLQYAYERTNSAVQFDIANALDEPNKAVAIPFFICIQYTSVNHNSAVSFGIIACIFFIESFERSSVWFRIKMNLLSD